MSFLLADLFSPTAAPGAVGGVVAAPTQGDAGAFAHALRAFRADAQGGPVAAEEAAGQPPARTLGVLGTSMLAAVTPERIAELGLDADILQRIQAGTPTPQDMETLVAALAGMDARAVVPVDGLPDEAPAPGETAEGAALGTSAAPAAAAPAPQTDPDAAAASKDNVEMALRIADAKRPYVPPRPDLPSAPADGDVPAMPPGERGASGTPQPGIADRPAVENAGAVKDVLTAALPRATAAAAAARADASPPPQTVPQAAQAIATTPHVTSVQAETVPASGANAPSAPGAPSKPEAGVPAPASAISVAANASDADAANAALSALAKDKTQTKPGAVQPQKTDTAAQVSPAGQVQEDAAETTDAPPAKPVSAGDEAARKDVKPEAPAAEKPQAAEKPAAPEPRALQAQIPAADKPVLTDAALRPAQQLQNLPAAAIPQIAGEMAARVRQGATRFEIRLDPPELGRVDVRIEIDSDGRVHSRLMVEKSETLDLLKADQRALERALHDAGFKSEQNSLSFSLRDERGGQARSDDQRFQRDTNVPTAPAEEEPARLAAELAYRAPLRGAGGIDMRV